MSVPYEYIKFAFTSGVLAENFHGRSDLQFYDAGLREAKNFFVNANGGIASRPGTKYLRNLGPGDFRAWRFRANTSVESDFLLIFSHNKLDIYQDNVLVKSFEGNSGEVPFALFSREHIRALSMSQWQNQMVITHENYQPVLLEKNDVWELARESTEGSLEYPLEDAPEVTMAEYISSASAPEGVLYGISAVDEDQVETPIWIYYLIEDMAEGSFVLLCWDEVPNAVSYRIYRSGIVGDGSKISLTVPLGFVGEVPEPAFTDTDLDPVYEVQPVLYSNPFQPGTVTHVSITNAGSGYGTNNSVGIIVGTGTGFAAVPVVAPDGTVVGHRLITGGRDYSDGDTVQFPGPTDAAAGVVVTTPREGIFPRTSVRFEQRRVYAGSTKEPMTLWVSQVGAYKTFGTRRIPSPADAFKIDLEAEELNPIRYMVPVSSGMLAFTSEEVFRIHGVDGFGPTSAASTPLQYAGCSEVQPLKVHGSVVYLEEGGRRVRAIAPGQQIGAYQNVDRSLLSNHFFRSDNQIISWDYARKPHDVIWCVREDGSMLAFTYAEEQGVFAWTSIDANAGEEPIDGELTVFNEGFDGKFKDVAVLQEQGNPDHIVYLLVQRGDDVYLETFAKLDVDRVEDIWGVDSGVQKVSDDPFTTVEGLDHLEGHIVVMLVDGKAQMRKRVVGGAVTLEEPGRKATVGLSFSGFIEPLPIRSVQVPGGRVPVSEARILAPKAIEVRTLKTLRSSMKYSTDKGDLIYDFPTRPSDVPKVDFLAPVSSEFIEGQPLEPDATVRIYKTGPGQVNVLGFDIDVDVDPNAIPITGELVL